jgi:hypothetical protein
MEPVDISPGLDEVDVVLPRAAPDRRAQLLKLIDHLRSLPPGTRTKEDIDRQIQEERNGWESRR